MAQASKMNRGYSSGLAAGAPAGGGFRSSFQSSFQSSMAPMPGTTLPPMTAPAPMEPMDFSVPEPPPVDFSNIFPPKPLPVPGQLSFSQPPPSPFGPAPLPFGGFRQEGGPVQPGLAYIVGEAGPELIVPQQPGMVLPNPTLTGRASAQDGAMRSGLLSTRGATPVGSGRGMTPERRLEIAARRGDQRANLALFNADQFGRNQRGAARALPPPMSMPMGRAPRAPSAAARPMPNFPPRSPAQQPLPEPMAAPQFDISNMLPPMAPTDAMAPLPPSTLMGGSGVPGPPDFQVNNVGSYEVLTQNTPNGPKFYNARVAPDAAPAPGMTTAGYRMLDDYNRQNPDKPLVFTGQFEPNGNPVLAPAPLEQQTETVTIDADGNERITRKRPVGSAPAPAPGPAGGAAPIERTTASGVQVRISTQR